MIRAFFTILSGLALAGCASATRQPVEIAPMVKTGEDFTLELGKAASVVNMGYVVVFDSVPEDSRCAVGTTCVWEGNARVALLIRRAWPVDVKTDQVEEHGMELNTSVRFPRKQEFGKYVVELRGLEPVGSLASQTTPYTATLLVSPNE